MTLDVEVGGRERRVDVSGLDGNYRVVVDGRAWTVDAARSAAGWSLLVRPDGVAGAPTAARSFDVTIAGAADDLLMSVDGRPIVIRIAPERRFGARRPGAAAGAGTSGPQRIAAPMPGRVVKLLVQAGDAVAARQGVVVVEAMKMENELRAPRAGTVGEIRVAEGALVEAGAVLVVIE